MPPSGRRNSAYHQEGWILFLGCGATRDVQCQWQGQGVPAITTERDQKECGSNDQRGVQSLERPREQESAPTKISNEGERGQGRRENVS